MESSLLDCDKEEKEMVLSMIEKIKKNKKDRFCYVSLGCGDGQKDSSIINDSPLFSCYYPIDINGSLIKIAFNEVYKSRSISNPLNCEGYIGDFTSLPYSLFDNAKSAGNTDRKIFLCLGHTIGNYQENLILDSVYKVMGESDYAIISFEKKREKSAARYRSSENTDFLLNPFKSIDSFSFVRNRFLKRSLVTGLSDVDTQVESYLFTLGFPNGLSLSPRHIIWTNRYVKSQIESFFNSHVNFVLEDIEEKSFNIVVLLKKKINENDLKNKIHACKEVLAVYKIDEGLESLAQKVEDFLDSNQEGLKKDFLSRILALRGQSDAIVKKELRAIIKEYKIR